MSTGPHTSQVRRQTAPPCGELKNGGIRERIRFHWPKLRTKPDQSPAVCLQRLFNAMATPFVLAGTPLTLNMRHGFPAPSADLRAAAKDRLEPFGDLLSVSI